MTPTPCPHNAVRLLAACVERRGRDSSVLIEQAVCLDCGDHVGRTTVLRASAAWVTLLAWPVPLAAGRETVYVCVPPSPHSPPTRPPA